MKNKFVLLAFFSFLISTVMFSFFDYEIEVKAEGAGDILGMIPYGAFNEGVSMSSVEEPAPFYQSSTWTYDPTFDYIAFRDSTSDPGFRVEMYMSSSAFGDFVYTGMSDSQSAISVDNFSIWGNYATMTYLEPDKGVDDSMKTLNILSSPSCASAENLSNYEFYTDIYNSISQYEFDISAEAKTYLRSSLDCEVEGRFRIERMELNFPPWSNEGSYQSTIVVLLIDGTND